MRNWEARRCTHAVPLQFPVLDAGPSMTLQYHPVGKPVAKDPPHTLSWLLMATKPREPIVPRYVSASATRRNGVGNVCTARKRYLLRRWRDPANERGAVYVIPEADHRSYGRPAVLTKPVNFYCPPFSQSSQPAAMESR